MGRPSRPGRSSPSITRFDGDVLFAASTAEVEDAGLDAIDLATIASELSWDAVSSSIPKSVDPAVGPGS